MPAGCRALRSRLDRAAGDELRRVATRLDPAGRRLPAGRPDLAPADASRLPAILEYIPYRKDDITAPQDESRMAWFAEHGYACMRVDLRGSGDSDGVLLDEYLAQEQDDALEVIAWIAAQHWCTGRSA